MSTHDELYQSLNEMHNAVVNEMIKCEEAVIIRVLSDLLHREPTIEDAKRCTRIYNTPHKGLGYTPYNLAYDNIILGVIDISDYKVTFTPSVNFR